MQASAAGQLRHQAGRVGRRSAPHRQSLLLRAFAVTLTARQALTLWPRLDGAQGELDKLIIVIKTADLGDEAVERYVIEFDWLVSREMLRRTSDWR